ncbi:hypothetical protein PGT21_020763 [Puccinia graminis f. sp. tritici]|uniref:Uncharacterized protein n=1 Tax=Puccinia graminis f. sp. tritici TaxID=56615 RepID=A0A5B0PSV9_PUCGR|nr:hypothetical protein PGT21_020763 [Puccinia graminis f. sp. tritici]
MQVYLLSSFILISLFLVQIGSVEYTDEKKILDPVLNGSPAFVDHTPAQKELDFEPGKNVQPHPQTQIGSQALLNCGMGPRRGTPMSLVNMQKIDQFVGDLLAKESNSGKGGGESSSHFGKILSELGKDLLVDSGSEDSNLLNEEDLSYFGTELNQVLDYLL